MRHDENHERLKAGSLDTTFIQDIRLRADDRYISYSPAFYATRSKMGFEVRVILTTNRDLWRYCRCE
jgi:hypothetical protein